MSIDSLAFTSEYSEVNGIRNHLKNTLSSRTTIRDLGIRAKKRDTGINPV